MMQKVLPLALLALLGTAACSGPEEPPNPECPPGEECPGYEPGMTTGKDEEVLEVEGPLEQRAPEITAPDTPIVGDSVVGTEPLSGH